ncbi:MAG: hypothetical protein ACOY0T_25455 [Myxococcota bacterium]
MKPKHISLRHPSISHWRNVLLAAPRVLVSLGALTGAIACLNACVSRLTYEEAASAAEVEREGHRRAEVELAAAKARIQDLEAELKSRSAGLEARDQKLAEEKYERNVASKERDETVSLVAQLRGELARANEHLESYAKKNARLEHELSVSREVPARSPISQEIRGILSSAHLEQSVRLTETAQGVTLNVPADVIWKRGDAELAPSLGTLSNALARFAEAHPELSITLREGAADPALPESIGRQRRESLRALLAHPKLAGRFSFEAPNTSSAPASYDLVLAFAAAR